MEVDDSADKTVETLLENSVSTDGGNDNSTGENAEQAKEGRAEATKVDNI